MLRLGELVSLALRRAQARALRETICHWQWTTTLTGTCQELQKRRIVLDYWRSIKALSPPPRRSNAQSISAPDLSPIQPERFLFRL